MLVQSSVYMTNDMDTMKNTKSGRNVAKKSTSNRPLKISDNSFQRLDLGVVKGDDSVIGRGPVTFLEDSEHEYDNIDGVFSISCSMLKYLKESQVSPPISDDSNEPVDICNVRNYPAEFEFQRFIDKEFVQVDSNECPFYESDDEVDVELVDFSTSDGKKARTTDEAFKSKKTSDSQDLVDGTKALKISYVTSFPDDLWDEEEPAVNQSAEKIDVPQNIEETQNEVKSKASPKKTRSKRKLSDATVDVSQDESPVNAKQRRTDANRGLPQPPKQKRKYVKKKPLTVVKNKKPVKKLSKANLKVTQDPIEISDDSNVPFETNQNPDNSKSTDENERSSSPLKPEEHRPKSHIQIKGHINEGVLLHVEAAKKTDIMRDGKLLKDKTEMLKDIESTVEKNLPVVVDKDFDIQQSLTEEILLDQALRLAHQRTSPRRRPLLSKSQAQALINSLTAAEAKKEEKSTRKTRDKSTDNEAEKVTSEGDTTDVDTCPTKLSDSDISQQETENSPRKRRYRRRAHQVKNILKKVVNIAATNPIVATKTLNDTFEEVIKNIGSVSESDGDDHKETVPPTNKINKNQVKKQKKVRLKSGRYKKMSSKVGAPLVETTEVSDEPIPLIILKKKKEEVEKTNVSKIQETPQPVSKVTNSDENIVTSTTEDDPPSCEVTNQTEIKLLNLDTSCSSDKLIIDDKAVDISDPEMPPESQTQKSDEVGASEPQDSQVSSAESQPVQDTNGGDSFLADTTANSPIVVQDSPEPVRENSPPPQEKKDEDVIEIIDLDHDSPQNDESPRKEPESYMNLPFLNGSDSQSPEPPKNANGPSVSEMLPVNDISKEGNLSVPVPFPSLPHHSTLSPPNNNASTRVYSNLIELIPDWMLSEAAKSLSNSALKTIPLIAPTQLSDIDKPSELLSSQLPKVPLSTLLSSVISNEDSPPTAKADSPSQEPKLPSTIVITSASTSVVSETSVDQSNSSTATVPSHSPDIISTKVTVPVTTVAPSGSTPASPVTSPGTTATSILSVSAPVCSTVVEPKRPKVVDLPLSIIARDPRLRRKNVRIIVDDVEFKAPSVQPKVSTPLTTQLPLTPSTTTAVTVSSTLLPISTTSPSTSFRRPPSPHPVAIKTTPVRPSSPHPNSSVARPPSPHPNFIQKDLNDDSASDDESDSDERTDEPKIIETGENQSSLDKETEHNSPTLKKKSKRKEVDEELLYKTPLCDYGDEGARKSSYSRQPPKPPPRYETSHVKVPETSKGLEPHRGSAFDSLNPVPLAKSCTNVEATEYPPAFPANLNKPFIKKPGRWDVTPQVIASRKHEEFSHGPRRLENVPSTPRRPEDYPHNPRRPEEFSQNPRRPGEFPRNPRSTEEFPNNPRRLEEFPNNPRRPGEFPNYPRRPVDFPKNPRRPEEPNYQRKPEEFSHNSRRPEEYPHTPRWDEDFPRNPRKSDEFPLSPWGNEDFPHNSRKQEELPRNPRRFEQTFHDPRRTDEFPHHSRAPEGEFPPRRSSDYSDYRKKPEYYHHSSRKPDNRWDDQGNMKRRDFNERRSIPPLMGKECTRPIQKDEEYSSESYYKTDYRHRRKENDNDYARFDYAHQKVDDRFLSESYDDADMKDLLEGPGPLFQRRDGKAELFERRRDGTAASNDPRFRRTLPQPSPTSDGQKEPKKDLDQKAKVSPVLESPMSPDEKTTVVQHPVKYLPIPQ